LDLRIAVPSGDITAARQILEKILDQEPTI
jgi:hypothetical protein